MDWLADEVEDGTYGVYTAKNKADEYEALVIRQQDGLLKCAKCNSVECEHAKAIASDNCRGGEHAYEQMEHPTGLEPRHPLAPFHMCSRCFYCEGWKCELEPVSKWDLDERV